VTSGAVDGALTASSHPSISPRGPTFDSHEGRDGVGPRHHDPPLSQRQPAAASRHILDQAGRRRGPEREPGRQLIVAGDAPRAKLQRRVPALTLPPPAPGSRHAISHLSRGHARKTGRLCSAAAAAFRSITLRASNAGPGIADPGPLFLRRRLRPRRLSVLGPRMDREALPERLRRTPTRPYPGR